jgi:hypothetical protein
MSDSRPPTRPDLARRQGTPLPYPVAPLTGPAAARHKPSRRPALDQFRRPLTNYLAFVRGADDRWRCSLHKGREVSPIGMNGYRDADAAFREIMSLGRMYDCHMLLTSDFLADLYAAWDELDRQAPIAARQMELS